MAFPVSTAAAKLVMVNSEQKCQIHIKLSSHFGEGMWNTHFQLPDVWLEHTYKHLSSTEISTQFIVKFEKEGALTSLDVAVKRLRYKYESLSVTKIHHPDITELDPIVLEGCHRSHIHPLLIRHALMHSCILL